MPARTVVLLGKGSLAIRIGQWFLDSGEYTLQCVVPSVPEPAWTDSLAGWARQKELNVVESGEVGDIPGSAALNWRTDLAFSVFYSRIVQAPFIARCGRILNLHNGPLPRYRGVSPINWALKNGESTHGVTIHEITPGVDDGPVVSQLTYSIYPGFDEVRDVYERALEYGWTLFEQTMPILDRIAARPQDETKALTYRRRDNDRLAERRNFTIAESSGV